MPKEENKKKHDVFLYVLLFMVLLTIIISFYFFYFKKDYDFFIETECNPETETCFYRDCENDPDVCLPNGFSYYNQHTIKAKDFKICKNEDCTEACGLGLIQCIKTECTEDDIINGVCVESLNTEN